MPIPYPSRQSVSSNCTRAATSLPTPLCHEWRCTGCDKLLGRRSGSVVLIQFARGHQYRAPRPVSAVCRGCGTLNET